MIKHIVMWKFKEGHEEEMNKFLSDLMSLKDKIDVIRSMQVGVNLNKNSEFNAVLISEFDNLDDLKTYKENPEHVKVSNFCKSIREKREAIDFEE